MNANEALAQIRSICEQVLGAAPHPAPTPTPVPTPTPGPVPAGYAVVIQPPQAWGFGNSVSTEPKGADGVSIARQSQPGNQIWAYPMTFDKLFSPERLAGNVLSSEMGTYECNTAVPDQSISVSPGDFGSGVVKQGYPGANAGMIFVAYRLAGAAGSSPVLPITSMFGPGQPGVLYYNVRMRTSGSTFAAPVPPTGTVQRFVLRQQ